MESSYDEESYWEGTTDDTTRSWLEQAVHTLHEAGFVHGDLCQQNILVTECSKVCMLDFDWADKVGQAHYPCDIKLNDGILMSLQVG